MSNGDDLDLDFEWMLTEVFHGEWPAELKAAKVKLKNAKDNYLRLFKQASSDIVDDPSSPRNFLAILRVNKALSELSFERVNFALQANGHQIVAAIEGMQKVFLDSLTDEPSD